MKNYLMFAACMAIAMSSQAVEVRKVVGNGGKVLYTNAATQAKSVAPPARSASDVLPPDVIGAVSNVLSMFHLVGRSRDFCGSSFPTSQKKFARSAQHWEQRNATVTVQQGRVMADDDQVLVAAALNGDALRKIDDMLRPVTQGSNAEKSRWCDQTFTDVDRGRLDLVGRASIAPLMRHVP